jgi:hypothetical protein
MAAVTVLVPAYRPNHRFVATLASLAAQTHGELKVHVSLDHAPDHVMPALPPVGDLDLVMTRQPQRLGWVGNVNALLESVATPYFMILSHDDCLTPGYIAGAVAVLESRPDVIVAHGDVRFHGVRDGEIGHSADIRGERLTRVRELLSRGINLALGWRGVARASAIGRGLKLRTRRSHGLFSNHLWEIELLLYGESAAVSGVYCDKYTDNTGLSRSHHRLDADEKSSSLADNIASLVDMVVSNGLDPHEQEEVVSGYLDWILSLQGYWDVVSDDGASSAMPFGSVRSRVARFASRIALNVAATELPPAILDPPTEGAGASRD